MLSDARIPAGRLDGAVPALVADEVAGGYGGGTVLHGVSLRLARGEMLAVLGRNGSGKSTLLRLLAGVLSPQAGTVLLEGLPLAHWSRRLRAQRLAVVAQELHVPFAFSVREVVELGRAPYARLLPGPHEDDRRAVAEALAVADLAGPADRPYQQLSGGEQQRVAIAMALAQEPSVLLLDEPTVHLDIAHQMAILALVRRLCATRGLAVLAAMHDINLTCLYFDRMLVLADGTLVASGSPDAVVSPALVERAFGARVAVGRHPRLAVPQVSLLP